MAAAASAGKRASHPPSPGPTATKTRVVAASPRLEKILTENGEENKTRRPNLTKKPFANDPDHQRHADVTNSQPFSKKLLLLTEEHKTRSEKKTRLQKLVFGRKGKLDILAKKPNGVESKKVGPGSEKVDEPPPSSGVPSGSAPDVNKIDNISNEKGRVPAVVPSSSSDCTKEDGICILPSKQKVSLYNVEKGDEGKCESVNNIGQDTDCSKNRDHVSESTVLSEPQTIELDSNQDPKPSGKARKVLGYVSPLPKPSLSRADQSERSVDVTLDESTWSLSLDDSTFNSSSVFSKSFREKFSTPASVRKFARSHLANIFTPRSHTKGSDRKKPSIVHLHIPSDVDIEGNDRNSGNTLVIAEALENVVPRDITNAPPKSKKGLKFNGKSNREMEHSESDHSRKSAGVVPLKVSTLKSSKEVTSVEEVPVTPANRVVRSRHVSTPTTPRSARPTGIPTPVKKRSQSATPQKSNTPSTPAKRDANLVHSGVSDNATTGVTKDKDVTRGRTPSNPPTSKQGAPKKVSNASSLKPLHANGKQSTASTNKGPKNGQSLKPGQPVKKVSQESRLRKESGKTKTPQSQKQPPPPAKPQTEKPATHAKRRPRAARPKTMVIKSTDIVDIPLTKSNSQPDLTNLEVTNGTDAVMPTKEEESSSNNTKNSVLEHQKPSKVAKKDLLKVPDRTTTRRSLARPEKGLTSATKKTSSEEVDPAAGRKASQRAARSLVTNAKRQSLGVGKRRSITPARGPRQSQTDSGSKATGTTRRTAPSNGGRRSLLPEPQRKTLSDSVSSTPPTRVKKSSTDSSSSDRTVTRNSGTPREEKSKVKKSAAPGGSGLSKGSKQVLASNGKSKQEIISSTRKPRNIPASTKQVLKAAADEKARRRSAPPTTGARPKGQSTTLETRGIVQRQTRVAQKQTRVTKPDKESKQGTSDPLSRNRNKNTVKERQAVEKAGIDSSQSSSNESVSDSSAVKGNDAVTVLKGTEGMQTNVELSCTESGAKPQGITVGNLITPNTDNGESNGQLSPISDDPLASNIVSTDNSIKGSSHEPLREHNGAEWADKSQDVSSTFGESRTLDAASSVTKNVVGSKELSVVDVIITETPPQTSDNANQMEVQQASSMEKSSTENTRADMDRREDVEFPKQLYVSVDDTQGEKTVDSSCLVSGINTAKEAVTKQEQQSSGISTGAAEGSDKEETRFVQLKIQDHSDAVIYEMLNVSQGGQKVRQVESEQKEEDVSCIQAENNRGNNGKTRPRAIQPPECFTSTLQVKLKSQRNENMQVDTQERSADSTQDLTCKHNSSPSNIMPFMERKNDNELPEDVSQSSAADQSKYLRTAMQSGKDQVTCNVVEPSMSVKPDDADTTGPKEVGKQLSEDTISGVDDLPRSTQPCDSDDVLDGSLVSRGMRRAHGTLSLDKSKGQVACIFDSPNNITTATGMVCLDNMHSDLSSKDGRFMPQELKNDANDKMTDADNAPEALNVDLTNTQKCETNPETKDIPESSKPLADHDKEQEAEQIQEEDNVKANCMAFLFSELGSPPYSLIKDQPLHSSLPNINGGEAVEKVASKMPSHMPMSSPPPVRRRKSVCFASCPASPTAGPRLLRRRHSSYIHPSLMGHLHHHQSLSAVDRLYPGGHLRRTLSLSGGHTPSELSSGQTTPSARGSHSELHLSPLVKRLQELCEEAEMEEGRKLRELCEEVQWEEGQRLQKLSEEVEREEGIMSQDEALNEAPTGLNGRPSTGEEGKNGAPHTANRPDSEDKRSGRGALTSEGQLRVSHHETSMLLPLPLTSSSQQEPKSSNRQNNTRKRVSTSDVPNCVNTRPTTLTKSASEPAFVVDGKQQKYVIEIHLSPTQEVVAAGEDQKAARESVEHESESVFLEGNAPSVVVTSPEKRQRNPFTRSLSLPVSPTINIVPCGDMHDKPDLPSNMAEVVDADDDWTRVVPRVLQKSDSISVPESSGGPFRRWSRSRTDSMNEALNDEGRIEMTDKEKLRSLDIDKDREVIHDIAHFLETQNEKPNSLPPDSMLTVAPGKIQNLEVESQSQSLPSSPMPSRRVGRHSLRSLPVSPHPENQPERSRSSTDSLDEHPRTNFLTAPVQPERPVTPKPYKKPASSSNSPSSSSPSSSYSHLSVNSPPPARPVTPKPHIRPSTLSGSSLSPKSSLLDIPQEDSVVMRPISPKFATITENTDVLAPQARLSAEPQSTGSPQLAKNRSRKTALSAKQNHVLMRISAAGSEDSGLGDSQSQLNLAVPSSEDKSLQKDAPTVQANEETVRYRRATKQRRRRPKSDLGSWVQKAPIKSRRPLTIHGTPHQESIEENEHSDDDSTDGKSLDKLTSLRDAMNLFTVDSPKLNRRNTVHHMLGSPNHPGITQKMSGVKEESTTPRAYMRTVSAYSPPMGTPALKRSRSTPCSLDRTGRRRIHSIDKGSGTPRSTTVAVELSGPSSDSESDDDNEATSVPSSPAVNRRSSFTGIPPGQDIDEMFEEEDEVTYAEALWDHVTMDPDELGFRAGEVIEVTDLNHKDWWWGCIEDREGWFPAAFVRLRVNQEDTVEDYVAKMRQGTSVNLRRYSVSFCQNKDQMRSNVVNEILSTERDYIGHLRDIIEGYVKQCRKRPEMFSCETIKTVFGNIEEIYAFQTSFLKTLEHSSRRDLPHLSEVGKCFLQHREGFEIYSEYCNNHPNAVTELNQIMKSKKYRHFFEACRLLQNMIDLALDGFLLTPVQKICKYPLQLAELLKYTKPEHRDHEDVKAALEAMKDVANLINERKRRLENIDKIAGWQQDVEGWEGEDVLDRSSQLIYKGDVRVITAARGKVQDRTLFLFDHQMVFCKKDLLKRDSVAYKERMLTGLCQVKPIPDGKDKELQTSVKNALKLYDMDKEKTYILCLKTPEQKMRWQDAFQEEREKVAEDKKKGFEIPLDVRKNAMNKSFRNKPCKPRADYRRMSKKYEVSEPSLQHVSLPRGISSKEVFAEVKQKRSIILPFFNFASKKSSRKASALN
ncbi:uncharacterized protein LOC144883775 isoform X2 [Branchiostoma floridae x Branchiostoma japonicum]